MLHHCSNTAVLLTYRYMADATVRIPKSEYDDLLRIKELAEAEGILSSSDASHEEDVSLYQPAFVRRMDAAAKEIARGELTDFDPMASV